MPRALTWGTTGRGGCGLTTQPFAFACPEHAANLLTLKTDPSQGREKATQRNKSRKGWRRETPAGAEKMGSEGTERVYRVTKKRRVDGAEARAEARRQCRRPWTNSVNHWTNSVNNGS